MAAGPEIEGYSDIVEVARGGFGVVYRGRQDRFDRVVALKVLNVENLDDHDRERFERECRAMGNLSWHPHVVAVHDSGITANGHPYLAMEYLDAGSLADRIAKRPLPWAEAVAAGIEVAGALGAAHAAGTLHRDLKPENVLVGPFGESKLGDFGIAAVEGGARTATGHASYTIAHVAPEVLRGERPDERGDVYGLASTIHTLVAGAPPFAGDRDEAIAAVITRVLQTPAPRLGQVPDELADLLQRALAKTPDDRPQTAEAFGLDLQAIQAANDQPVTTLRLARIAAAAADDRVDDEAVEDAAVDPGGVHPGGGDLPAVDRDSDVTVHRAPTETVESPAEDDPNRTVHAASVPDAPVAASRQDGATLAQEPAAGGPDRSAAQPSKRGKLVGAIVGVIVVIAVAGGAAAVLSGGDDPDDPGPPSTTTPPSDPTNTVTESIAVGDDPESVRANNEAVWVLNRGGGTVTRVDPDALVVAATIQVGDDPGSLAATTAAVWVTGGLTTPTVQRIDPATDDVIATVDAGFAPGGVAVTSNAVWVSRGGDEMIRIDPANNAIVATIAGVPGGDVKAVEDDVWVANAAGDIVTRIDAASDTVTASVTVGDEPRGLAATTQAVWVANFADDTVSRIDPATNDIVATISVGDGPSGIAATAQAVWVTNRDDGTVTRIDPATDEVVATISVGGVPEAIAVTDRDVWYTNSADQTVNRIEPG